MVNDGFSDSDQRPAVADHLDRNSNDPLLGSPVDSLTQELAQLLAALIAQSQANKGGALTNAEVTSLAKPRLGRCCPAHNSASVQGEAFDALLHAACRRAAVRTRP